MTGMSDDDEARPSDDRPSDDRSIDDPVRYGRPYPYGQLSANAGMGGVAAPLLAGFAIGLLGLVLQVEAALRWPDLALLLLAVAVLLLLAAVQLGFRAAQYAVTPTQAAEWHDDFATSAERRARVSAELREGREAYRSWIGRAATAYDAGIAVLFAGLAVALVPAASPGVVRLLAAGVAGLGCLAELGLSVAGHLVAWDRAPRRVCRVVWWVSSADPRRRP
jgi:hypothetical protein